MLNDLDIDKAIAFGTHPWQLQIKQLLAVATKMSSRGSV